MWKHPPVNPGRGIYKRPDSLKGKAVVKFTEPRSVWNIPAQLRVLKGTIYSAPK